MKIALDQRLSTIVKTDWKALEWMVEFVGGADQSVFGGS